ncbi:WXG100 family type VII secretion target [Nocardioides sp. R1-1]|uniref:WXG100 family type VII secretion target n=1 Tax=Nocardioides sp. R1-1 TaxID=3383502 RepID=UPI0038CFFE1B
MADQELTFDDIDSAADKLETGKEDLASLLTELRSLVQELTDSSFKTEAASVAFLDSYEELSDGLETALEAIPAAATALRQMKTAFQDTDSGLASS